MRRGSEQGVRVAFAPSAWVAPHPKAEKRDISGGAFRAIRRQGTRQGTNYVYVFHTYSSHFGDVCRYIPREGASWETALNDVLDPASRYIPREGASWEDDILNDAIRNMDTSRARVRVGSALASSCRPAPCAIHSARGCELGVLWFQSHTQHRRYIPRASWKLFCETCFACLSGRMRVGTYAPALCVYAICPHEA